MPMNLEKAQAFADRRLRKTLYSAIFKRCPLANFLMGVGEASNLDRPKVRGILSGAKIKGSQKETVDGGVSTDVFFLASKSGGGRTMTRFGVNPAVELSQDQTIKSARFFWYFYQQPIKVWRSTMLLSGKGKHKIFDAMTTSIDLARDECADTFAQKVWTGQPSTYNVTSDEDMYTDLPGVLEAMSATNTYGNVNRADATQYVDGTHPWASTRESNARAATVELIDEANDVCQVKGPGVDLVLCSRAIYRKLKREARALGGTIVSNGQIPGHGMLGYVNEFIQYGNTCIAYDPFAPEGHLAAFTMEDWVVEFHPEMKGQTDAWYLEKTPGGDQAYNSAINMGVKMYCTKPKNQYLFTNVSAA